MDMVVATGAWGGSSIHLMMDRKQSMRKTLGTKNKLESHALPECSANQGSNIPCVNTWGTFHSQTVRPDPLNSVLVRAKSTR